MAGIANGDDDVIVKAIDVSKRFYGREVLQSVSLEVRRGEVVCIVGPSGAGKSTFLRCINHLEKVDDGIVLVGGEVVGWDWDQDRLRERGESAITRQRQRIGMVFQLFNLFSHLTALENVTLGPRVVKRINRRDADRIGREALAEVGLAGREDSYPHRLSGGQQQRVAIARALAMQPEVMLFDEPTSALDPELVGEVLTVIARLAREGMTMLIVTHEMAFARDVATTVAVMDEGSIIEQGRPDEVLTNPTHPRTRAFLARVRESAPDKQEETPSD